MLFAECDGLVPGGLGMDDQRLVRALVMDEGDRIDRERLIAGGLAIGGAAMVALTRSMLSRFGSKFGNGPSSLAISADVA